MISFASDRTLSRAASRNFVAVAAFLAGLALFAAAGLAWPSAIHNATHDARHALGLPCH